MHKKWLALFFALILCMAISLIKESNNNDMYLMESQKDSIGVDQEEDFCDEIDNFSIPITNIDDLLNNRISGFVYFGRDTCPMCLQFNHALSLALEKNTDVVIYKFDTDVWRTDQSFQKVLDKFHVTSIPCLVKVTNSKSFVFGSDSSSDLSQSDLEAFLSS